MPKYYDVYADGRPKAVCGQLLFTSTSMIVLLTFGFVAANVTMKIGSRKKTQSSTVLRTESERI